MCFPRLKCDQEVAVLRNADRLERTVVCEGEAFAVWERADWEEKGEWAMVRAGCPHFTTFQCGTPRNLRIFTFEPGLPA